jgi:DNA polymerase I-like protein with 3'-5' exonuclease and polymerase domains
MSTVEETMSPAQVRARNFVAAAKTYKRFAFDIEHDPNVEPTDVGFIIHGCSFCCEDMVFYETDLSIVQLILLDLFDDPELEAIAFNGKYDLKCLISSGIITQYQYPKSFVDPMIGVNLLDDNRKKGEMGLKSIIYDKYKHVMVHFEEAIVDGLTSVKFRLYAEDDARQEYRLWSDIRPELEKSNLLKVLTKVLCPASLVFADMELAGLHWDLKGARDLLRGYQALRDEFHAMALKELGPINLASGDQLAKRLFEELGYSTEGVPLTKSGKRYSVDADTMEMLAKKYPICQKIARYRTAEKMINTYVEPITRKCLADVNRRVHPSFWQISATGRTRCEDPNFQNIPSFLAKEFSHLSIKKNFIAAPGHKFIIADLSQIELRLVAHITQDPLFLAAYKNWTCTACGQKGTSDKILHSCPNCGQAEVEAILQTCPNPKCKTPHVNFDKKTKTCGVCRGEVTKEVATIRGFWHGLDLHQITTDKVSALGGERQNGKVANFALVYCATATRMHYEYPDMSKSQWQSIIDQYMETYKGVARWHERMERGLHESGVGIDIFGRRRRIPRFTIQQNKKHALNQFVNFGPQAGACEMMQLSMSRIREECIGLGTWINEIVQVNMVHDEGVWEVKEDKVEQHAAIIQKHLENSVQLRVPVRTSLIVSDCWSK